MLRGFCSSKIYCYKATILDVINRSTVIMDIDLGFNIYKKNQKYKIATIDSHAYKSKIIDSKYKVLTFINPGDIVIIKSVESNKIMYCDIYTDNELSDLYHYNSYCTHIVDGDTIDINIDLGFNMAYNTRFRLANIDCWEVRGDEREQGLLATARVLELIPPGTNMITKTIKDSKGKYGRYLCEIFLLDKSMSLNTILLNEGHVILYEG